MHVINALHYTPTGATSIVEHASILGLEFWDWHIYFCLHFLCFSLMITSMVVSHCRYINTYTVAIMQSLHEMIYTWSSVHQLTAMESEMAE